MKKLIGVGMVLILVGFGFIVVGAVQAIIGYVLGINQVLPLLLIFISVGGLIALYPGLKEMWNYGVK